MCTAKTVVSDIGTTATGVEVNQHVRVGQVAVGHTEVDSVAFDVGHQEVVRAVAAHHTGHSVAGWVEGVATVPVFVRTVDVHGLRLERSGNVGSTLVVRGHQEKGNFTGWVGTQVGGLNAHEVGFVDDSRTGDDDLAGVQRVADRGHVGVVASVDLNIRGGPRHVLNGSGSVNHRQSGGCVGHTTVPAERRVFNVHTDGTGGVHWVDPNIGAALNVETRTGGTTVNVCVNGHHVGVFGEHTVVSTGDGSIANHEQVAVLLADTGGVAADVRTVEGQDRVGVVAEDTDGGSQAVSGEDRVHVAVITVLDHDGVVANVDGVRSGLNSHGVTIGCGDTHSVRRGSTGGQTDGVATHGWTSVARTAARGLKDVDGCTTIAPGVAHDQGVVSSVRIASEWVVVRVATKRVGRPAVLGAVRLGDLNADFVAPAVGSKVHVCGLAGGEVPGTTGASAVIAASNRTKRVCWGWRRFHTVKVDTTVSVGQRVVRDVSIATEDVDTRGGCIADAANVVSVNGEVRHTVEVEGVVATLDRVVCNQDIIG